MSHEQLIDFSRPIVEGLKSVFSTMVGVQLSGAKPAIKTDNKSLGDISAFIGLNGVKDGKPFVGVFALSFPKETYLKVASKMLMAEYTEIDDDILDTGAEICNMVTGNAKRTLAENGYKIEMATPTTVSGENHIISYPKETKVVVITVDTDLGSFFIELCLQPNAEEAS